MCICVQALAWRLLNHEGQEVWYNWRANISQVGPPDELSDELKKEVSVKNTHTHTHTHEQIKKQMSNLSPQTHWTHVGYDWSCSLEVCLVERANTVSSAGPAQQ